ncbi:MAG: alpha/beta fold hydrolase, partial [Acidimicrobiia bacterium]
MRRNPVLALATMAVVVALGGSGIVAPGAVSSAAAQMAPLTWRSCQQGLAECATLAVPLDDTVAGGPTIDLAITRAAARDPDRRIGSLVVNPGGPGAPATDFAVDFASSLPDEILDRFDIVGFDPRGVGESEGVDCLDDLDPLYALDWTSTDAATRAEFVAGVQAIVDACVASDGALLPYLATERTARDMDRVREALGDERLTYLGFSYGTYLGALYAAQFPDRVRALVLDAAVDPSLDAAAVQIEQSVGFERSLELFLADCAADPECAFHHDGDPGAAYDALRARIADRPIPAPDAPGQRDLNTTLFDTGVTLLLYDGRSSWPAIADALRVAEQGNGSAMVDYADVYTGRSTNGRYDDLQESFWAVGCADGPDVGGVEGLARIEEAAARAAPRL